MITFSLLLITTFQLLIKNISFHSPFITQYQKLASRPVKSILLSFITIFSYFAMFSHVIQIRYFINLKAYFSDFHKLLILLATVYQMLMFLTCSSDYLIQV